MPKDFMTIDRRKLDNLARAGASDIVQRITIATAAHARSLAPGGMKNTIRPIFTPGANALGIVMVDHPAASYVLRGTKPHPITPRKPGGYLRFEVGGDVIFTKHVNHPGTKANDFLWKALSMARFVS